MFGVWLPDGFNIHFKTYVTESGGFSSSLVKSSTLGGQVFGEYDSEFLRVSFLNIFAPFLVSLHWIVKQSLHLITTPANVLLL